MSKILLTVCARGGSKGIPGKNIKEFCGKPLLGWILEAAKEAKVFDDIILSTDSEEIAEVGRSYGATVPGLRPAALATDDSDVFDNKMNGLSSILKNEGKYGQYLIRFPFFSMISNLLNGTGVVSVII